jgi:hypothetical protein
LSFAAVQILGEVLFGWADVDVVLWLDPRGGSSLTPIRRPESGVCLDCTRDGIRQTSGSSKLPVKNTAVNGILSPASPGAPMGARQERIVYADEFIL